jgi:hypothetical protein
MLSMVRPVLFLWDQHIDHNHLLELPIAVCTGKVQPTEAEFNALAKALDISNVRRVPPSTES